MNQGDAHGLLARVMPAIDADTEACLGLVGGSVWNRRFTQTQEHPMTDDRLPLAALPAKAGDGDFLRSVAEAVVQLLMETDVEGLIGPGGHERTGASQTLRHTAD